MVSHRRREFEVVLSTRCYLSSVYVPLVKGSFCEKPFEGCQLPSLLFPLFLFRLLRFVDPLTWVFYS